MSERHGVQESTLKSWANLGYITSSRIGEQLFLDDESLATYLEAHKRVGLEMDYLSKMIEEKKLERDYIISKYDDMLYVLRTQKACKPLYSIIIRELTGLIINPDTRLANILHNQDVRTVRDLLEIVSGRGWKSLLRMDGVGKISYYHLLSKLQMLGVVDESLNRIVVVHSKIIE